MAVVRSLFGRLSGDAESDLKVAGNIVCLSDDDRIIDDPPEAISIPAEDFVRPDRSGVAEKFSLGVEPTDAPLQTLGELMTMTREQAGLSREQVAEQIHIPAYYVRMIESDSYDAIPDQLYLLPFFRRYAIFLGLDAQKVVSRFIVDFEKAESQIVDIKALKVPQAPKAPKAPKAAKAPADKNASAKSLLLWRQVASAVLVVGVVLTLVTRGFGIVGGTVNRTIQHPATNPSSVASPASLPASIILSSDEPHRAEAPPPDAQQPAAIPSADIAAPETSTASASPEIEQPSAPAKHHRHRGHGHRTAKHSKHSTHKPG
jgi:cytoskeletal protein RodZ